ncbi:dolichol kinase isoform X1 [Bactrocera neohumeralis]|uniref:dolichol kinase isoform X1 n=2 Tax=Bactrocera neohumeralis TaxID=98809 RepID=UPI00216646E3|nr:dolichol kinase isoform X1 [Bactrocera neohumeralis]XP_050326941.1 dolichol kinase isoform X1 [Bactrocera neohumeralis]
MGTEKNEVVAESSEDNSGIAHTGNGRISNSLFVRPNASPGYWLCLLLPLAFASNLIHENKCNTQISTQPMLTIAAVGMSIDTLCLFLYMFCKTGLLLKLFISFVPGFITTILYKVLLQQSWSYGLFWGFIITFIYQKSYIRVLRGLPGCFSFGEASILVQGLMLFLLNVILKFFTLLLKTENRSTFEDLNIIMMCALTYLLAICGLLTAAKVLRGPTYFYALMFILVIGVTSTPITDPVPIIFLLNFILQDQVRVYIVVFYVIMVLLTFLTVWWQIGNEEKASTRIRKIFHVLIVLVFIPGIIYQCSFLYIATGVALAIFTVFELIRVCNIPPLAIPLRRAFASFSDEKDAGLLALTPFCLLIGCSIPLWISSCPCGENEYTNDNSRLLSILAGVLTIGFGDTAASVVGSKFGRIKWRSSKKSLEGTLAFMVMTFLATMFLNYFGYTKLSAMKWFSTSIAILTTSLVEAHTDQIDNLTLPLIFYIIVNIF